MAISPIALCTRCSYRIQPRSAHEPPPSHFLRSNYYPTADEIKNMVHDREAFDSAIRETQICYSALEEAKDKHVLCKECGFYLESSDPTLAKEKERLWSRMEELTIARRQMTKCEELFKPFAVPIRRLPSDILEAIFRIHRDGDIDAQLLELRKLASSIPLSWSRVATRLSSPLNLSHTCHVWREIVFSRPKLWDTMLLNVRLTPRGVMPLLRLFLRQSNDMPLNLYIADHHVLIPQLPFLSSRHLTVPAALLLLLSQSHRWKDVTLILPRDYFDDAIQLSSAESSILGGSSFPQLETLELSWPGRRGLSHGNVLNIWQHSPRLRTLSLPYYQTSFTLPSLLTTLCITRIDGECTWILPVLRSCRYLQYITLMWHLRSGSGLRESLNTDFIPDDDILVHPTLKSVQVRFDILRPWITELFHQLIAPHLESIDISPRPNSGQIQRAGLIHSTVDTIDHLVGQRFGGWPEDAFLRFLSRMGTGPNPHSLRSLTLAGIVLSDTYMMKVFDLVPGLTQLTLYEVLGPTSPPEPPIWSFQLLQKMNVHLLPKLVCLDLTLESSFHNFLVVQLGIAMVRARVRARCLKRFTIRCREEFLDQIPTSRLQALTLEGLIVEVNGTGLQHL